MKPGVEITTQRAEEFSIEAQREGESDASFKDRVSGEIREMGHMIEAHEAYNNSLYNDTDDGGAMTGIVGAMAQALQGTNFGARTGSQQVGDDIAAGHIVQSPEQE